MQNAVHMDNSTDAVHVHISHQTQNHHSLHQQLPVLRLGDVVQDRLHLHCKLDLSCCHLHKKTSSHTSMEVNAPQIPELAVACYLSCGGRGQHVSINGQAVALLQNLPNFLVETHRHPVDCSIQPPSPQPLALPLLPVQLPVSQAMSHWGQHSTGGRGAAATLQNQHTTVLTVKLIWAH